jgi:hypothetical protein
VTQIIAANNQLTDDGTLTYTDDTEEKRLTRVRNDSADVFARRSRPPGISGSG